MGKGNPGGASPPRSPQTGKVPVPGTIFLFASAEKKNRGPFEERGEYEEWLFDGKTQTGTLPVWVKKVKLARVVNPEVH